MDPSDSFFSLNEKESTESVHPVQNYEVTNKNNTNKLRISSFLKSVVLVNNLGVSLFINLV